MVYEGYSISHFFAELLSTRYYLNVGIFLAASIGNVQNYVIFLRLVFCYLKSFFYVWGSILGTVYFRNSIRQTGKNAKLIVSFIIKKFSQNWFVLPCVPSIQIAGFDVAENKSIIHLEDYCFLVKTFLTCTCGRILSFFPRFLSFSAIQFCFCFFCVGACALCKHHFTNRQ